jgi:hypothetical protein
VILEALAGVVIGALGARLARRPAAAQARRSTRSEPPEITAAKTISCALRDLNGPRECRRVLMPVWDIYITEPEEQLEQARRVLEPPRPQRPISVVLPVYFDDSAVRH